MANRAKQKGTAAETAVCEYLRPHFPYVERRTLAGVNDKGDIAGLPGVVLEVKSCKELSFGPWLKELDREMANANAEVGAVIAKRRGTTDVGEWFAVMPVRVLLELLKEDG